MRAPRPIRGGLTPALTGALAVVAVAVVALLLRAPAGSSQSSTDSAVPQPVLGVMDLDATLMGAARQRDEVWAYRLLPRDVPPPVVDGRPLEFGPGSDAQLAFLRFRRSTGWQVVETPVDDRGRPHRGLGPNRLSPRITPRGGGLLVGRDSGRPLDSQATVLVRNPSGRFAAVPDPLRPPAPGAALLDGEQLAEERGSGRVVTTAFDEGDRTGAFFAALGGDLEDAVVHYDGQSWSREPVIVPPGTDQLKIVALGAPAGDNAWLLARPDPDLPGGGLAVYERVGAGPGARWERRDLGSAVFQDRATPAEGVSEVAPLEGTAESLTVTADGVWIDGGLRAGGTEYDFTLFFDPDDPPTGPGDDPGGITGSWCDAPNGQADPLCAHPLGSKLSRRDGYRSFAFDGTGFGGRIVTNPLELDGAEDSNRGSYLRLDGTRFTRVPGAGGNFRRGGAFLAPDEGWLDGPIHITRSPEPQQHLTRHPLPLRAPLTAVVGEPGKPPAGPDSQALAVGFDGAVARFLPGRGWTREFLLNSSGAVTRSNLRGVAWPEPGRAHAVGDLGAMWLWRSETGLWERDPGAPIGFESNLMDVAFAPDDPQRGYAVGKEGTLLRYDKSWTQESPPPGFGEVDFTQIAFTGSEALVAAGGELLVNDGSGWKVDQSAHDLLESVRRGTPSLYAVAGLPDGGAIAAGRDFVMERDGPGRPWRFADQPLIDSTVVAAAGFRDGERVRAVVSVVPRLQYPTPDLIPEPDPNSPAPIIPPFPLPGDGYVLRETGSGWRDEQHTAFAGSSLDRPIKSDPIAAFELDAGGEGWAIGGWSGEADFAGRGSSAKGGQGINDRARVQTAGVYRYSGGTAPDPPATTGAAPIKQEGDVVRLAVGGHAQCEAPCADLSRQDIAPDETLTTTLRSAQDLARGERGPRLFLYTGGRLKANRSTPPPAKEQQRFADLLGSASDLPVFAAPSAGDTTGSDSGAFRSAFATFPAPFGAGPSRQGISAADVPGAAPAAGARTHYAFDTTSPGGAVRVIVIDNSAGSLAASDPHQNPREPQLPWLTSVLADAKAKGIVTVVMGSRDLNTRFRPSLNVASDGNEVAQVLVEGGASAYFYERPEENRVTAIPSGAEDTIPAYGTGSLGYRSPLTNVSSDRPDQLFGDTGFFLAELDVSRRDPGINRAPVSVRLIPTVEDVSLQALDGTLLRRSRPALFQGLGRRPLSGDRWGGITADGDPDPAGGDPYTVFPPALCRVAGCSTRVTAEYEFISSDPDIGDFVKQDPASGNPRKVFLGSDGKPVTDAASGLFCAFNAGTATVTVRAGGLSYSQQVTVQAGSVQRPCGTRPLDPRRFETPKPPNRPPPPPPSNPPPSSPPVELVPPPPPVVPAAAPPPAPPLPAPPSQRPKPEPPPRPAPPPLDQPPLPIPDSTARVPGTPPPTAPTAVRPIPPGGAVARVYQVEEKREEELAPEESQAFSRYQPDDGMALPPGLLVGLVALAAMAGAAIATAPRARARTASLARRRRPAPALQDFTHSDYLRRRRWDRS